MSNYEPAEPYLYQPHPVSRKDGKLWSIGLPLSYGMSREQAEATVRFLKTGQFAEAVEGSPAQPPQTCEWTLDDYGGDSEWQTGCGQSFVMIDDPADLFCRFCCYCGKPIAQHFTSQERDPAASRATRPETPLPEGFDYETLDPGIRDVVRRLRLAGFDTTDSGDGVSKSAEWYASGEAIPFPHVVATTTPETMIAEAGRMGAVLGQDWAELKAKLAEQTRRAEQAEQERDKMREGAEEMAKEYHALLHEEMYAGTRADWIVLDALKSASRSSKRR